VCLCASFAVRDDSGQIPASDFNGMLTVEGSATVALKNQETCNKEDLIREKVFLTLACVCSSAWFPAADLLLNIVVVRLAAVKDRDLHLLQHLGRVPVFVNVSPACGPALVSRRWYKWYEIGNCWCVGQASEADVRT
jgi:hypothetical protein